MLLKTLGINLKLTLPILLTRMLGITSNIIAMILIAELGHAALSASAVIMGIFSFCVLMVIAFSFSICALVAEACGRKKDASVGSIISSSLLLNSLLAIPFMIFFYNINMILECFHQPPAVINLVGQYFRGMLPGYLPMLWASILEQLFIGIGKPRYIVYLSILGVFIMPVLSNAFIFGKYGFNAHGMLGAGYAVSLTSMLSLLFLLALIIFKKWHIKYKLFAFTTKSDYSYIKKLYQLGWPTALQYGGEFLAYIIITLMMGWIGIVALAAQQIILQFTAVVAMIPTSVAHATAVLVGQAKGEKDDESILHHTNASLIVVSCLMLVVGLIYLLIPERLAHIYLHDNSSQGAAILLLAKSLFMITAFSQCFDGVRNVLAGSFRGLQETKLPMLIGTTSLWMISIPLAYFMGFILHHGAVGVRMGFAIGILVATSVLSYLWYRNQYSFVLRAAMI